MAKRWTETEDAFLLQYADAVSADFIASHDLGRPNGSGSARMRHLIKTGAAAAYAHSEAWRIDYQLRAGRIQSGFGLEMAEDERSAWAEKAERWGAQQIAEASQ